MKGWLVYDALGAQRNEWYISRLQAEAEKYGLALLLKIVEKGDLTALFEGDLPDFAIVRTICPKINARLEALGVRTFNNAKTAELACDKYKTYLACKAWNIPVLPTWRAGERTEFPCVMKRTDGHGGTEVFWIKNQAELEKYAQTGGEYIYQKPNKILGKDMRVYTVGGEIVGAVLRSSSDSFKSNFSLGGSVQSAEVDKEQKAIVAKLYKELAFDYVGIDFLPTEEGWVLNEIEDSAGARMLYQCTDVDIAALFIRHVYKQLSR